MCNGLCGKDAAPLAAETAAATRCPLRLTHRQPGRVSRIHFSGLAGCNFGDHPDQLIHSWRFAQDDVGIDSLFTALFEHHAPPGQHDDPGPGGLLSNPFGNLPAI